MSHIPSINSLPTTEKLYHKLLFIYPATHRREYGPLMAQLFRDLCRDSYRQKGFVGLVRLWIHVLADTTVTAAVEHMYSLQKEIQIMTKQQHRIVLSFAGFPLYLWVFLSCLNPKFMGQIFTPNQPAGWLVVVAIVLLVGIAYVAQRKIIVMAHGERMFFFAGTVLLFSLPATLAVLLGPALVTILASL
jgi:hypothetical protein